MEIPDATANRRPLKSRGTVWAAAVARFAVKSGISSRVALLMLLWLLFYAFYFSVMPA